MLHSVIQELPIADSLVSVMLEFVRATVLEKDPIISPDIDIDWDKLMDLSAEQGVLVWVWDGICKLPVEKQPTRLEKINWGLSAREWCTTYQQQTKVLSNIIEVCSRNGIRVLLLKGIGLSVLYPRPESRVCGDIDIYLFENYEKGNELLSDGKYIFGKGDKHACFVYKNVTVENHRTIINTNTRQQRRVEKYIESTASKSELTQWGFYVLPPMTNLIFLVMHALSHMESQIPITIRNLMDIAFLLHKNRRDIDSSNLLKIVQRVKLAKPFELLLSMSERVSGFTFNEYHNNRIIPRNDVDRALRMLICRNTSIDFPLDGPLVSQIRHRWEYYKKMRWKYKYLPNSRMNVIISIFRPSLSSLYKKLLISPHHK